MDGSISNLKGARFIYVLLMAGAIDPAIGFIRPVHGGRMIKVYIVLINPAAR